MPCQWSPVWRCPFTEYANALIERDGRAYCPLHLPLVTGKLNAADFAKEFRARQEQGTGHDDFRGVVFPGEPETGKPFAVYNVVRHAALQDCTFGERVKIVIFNVCCALTSSKFLGASQISITGSQ